MDALNRSAQTQYIDGTRVTNNWDAAGQQLTGADVTGIYSYLWDLDGRKIVTQNPTGINLTQTLDPVGNRLVLADPFGVTSYSWDQQSRLQTIQNPLNEVTSIQWDALDRELHRVLANGMTVSHTYDGAGRETVLQNISAAGVGLAIFTNTYSPTDNRIYVTELDSTLCTFGYDPTSQLISEARSGTYAYNTSYVYDSRGNRLRKYDSGALTQYSLGAANELLVVTPSTGFPTTNSFDANGNMAIQNAGGQLTSYTWSAENRLLNLANPDGTSEQYQYSQDGLRKEKASTAGTTLFTWDNQNVLLETSPSGVVQARYTDSPGRMGGLTSQNRSAISGFYGFDSLGSTRILVSLSGAITDSYSFTEFGQELQSGSGTINASLYLGKYGYQWDSSSMLYSGAMYLSLDFGRWLSRVSRRTAKVGNEYSYPGNSPGSFNPLAAPAPPGNGGLGIAVVTPGHATGPCGGATFVIRWLIPIGVAGWVIQHIVKTATITNCDGTPRIEASCVKNGPVEFYEGFEAPVLEDTFGIIDEPGSCGTVTTIGHARFVPGFELYRNEFDKNNKWCFPGDACHTACANSAPTMTSPPLLPAFPGEMQYTQKWSDSGTVFHMLKSTWNCCSTHNVPTSVIAIPPYPNFHF